MGCRKVGHDHKWPETGRLIIQSCERRCNFCAADGESKKLSSATSLREHVRAIHIKKGPYRKLMVSDLRDEERAPSEAPEGRGRAHVRAVLARRPVPGPSKRRRNASPASIDSGAYCGIDSEVKIERDPEATVTASAESPQGVSPETPKKRRNTPGAESCRQPAINYTVPPEMPPNGDILTGRHGWLDAEETSGEPSASQERDEYAFVTLAKARTTALSFGPALQEVVQDGYGNLFIKPNRLAKRMTAICGRLERAGAQPARINHVRSCIQAELRARAARFLASLPSGHGEQSGILTPPSSVAATPKSQDHQGPPGSPSPELQDVPEGSQRLIGHNEEVQVQKGKLKRINGQPGVSKASISKLKHGTSPRGFHSPSGSQSCHATSSMSQILVDAPKQQQDRDQEYWSQPTAVPWPPVVLGVPHRSPTYVLLPFGTPQVPIRDVPIEEVEGACSIAFGVQSGFEQVIDWGHVLRVAVFTTWEQAKKAFGQDIRLRGIAFHARYLPKRPSRTFAALLSVAEMKSLDRVTQAFFAYTGRSLRWNLPELSLQQPRPGAQQGCKLIAHFRSAPKLVELHLPVHSVGDGPSIMASFFPVDMSLPCWRCEIRHGQLRCQEAELIERPGDGEARD